MIYEIAILSLLGISGVFVANLIGFKNPLALITVGFLFSVVGRVFSFSALSLLGFGELGFVFFLALAAHMIVIPIILGVIWKQVLIASGLVVVLAGVSAFLTRGLGLSAPVFGDSVWILTMSDLMQSGGDLSLLGGRVAIKRGFSYPLLLALGENGEFLSGVTPFIFLLVIAAIGYGVMKLGGGYLSLLVLALIGSVSIVQRAMFYINGHMLVALGLTVSVIAIVVSLKNNHLAKPQLYAIMAGFSVVSFTRPEGIALVALTSLVLLSKPWVSRKQLMLIISSATVSFATWLAVYESYFITSIGIHWSLFFAVLVALGLIVATPIFDLVRKHAVPLAFIAMGLVIVLAFVLFSDALIEDLVSQYQNLVLGQGLWGYVFVVSLVVVLAIKNSPLKTILLLLVLGSVIAKMLDGGQFGEPSLGRLGWGDSLNRMWLHLSGILALTVSVGIKKLGRK